MKDQQESFSRRDFIRLSGLSTLSLTLGYYISGCDHTVKVINSQTASSVIELVAWISIDTNGDIKLMNHRSEMGQGTQQTIPQILAEELEVGMDQITVVSASANPKKYGPQPQEGSFSVRGWCQQLLKMGATARQMLIMAAAKQWNVPVTECSAKNGQVYHQPTNQKAGYGSLVEEATKIKPPSNVTLKERKDYTIIGKPLPRNDIPSKVNGTAVFGLDKKLPGLLYAVVERNPRFRGKVKSFDDTETRKIIGVKHVCKVQRAVFGSLYEGVAVVANSIWAAMQGRKVLRVEWDDTGFDYVSTEQMEVQMRQNLKKPAPSPQFEKVFKQASDTLSVVYETPYQAHSCMEPLNCTVHVHDNRIDVWGPLQEANWTQADLSQRMNIPIENVTVHMTFLGGGFGRKAFTDYPHEAALLSKELNAPVQVVWTREDDMIAGPFRPGAFFACRGGLDKEGKIMAFQTITSTQWIGQEWSSTPYADPEPAGYNKGGIEGLLQPYYKSIPHYSFAGIGNRVPMPVMWWRSVYASTNGFACESFIDELAHKAQKDPMDFRRRHLLENRYQAFIDKLEAVSSWKSRTTKGWGVAITQCFGSIAGHIVIVSRNADKKLQIDKIIALMDCGWYVNPDIIKAQVEGAIVMGLGAACLHAIHFQDGMTVEKNFDTYLMPRILDIPEIEVHIMENNEKPGGVGEPGLPPFAPALCNAIFDLTGKRIRKLPFALDEI
ncbi:xanthine dehydrogenase family protein molybdopterin-binding subunit [Xanthocytophaga agilis]|uniref:Molybdopterin-dependent oxidoreductase n=1 Tax=Xanthocytophaga agilis TaxID=3048010 RepID=A0AAE3UCR3_9BACT|nr:molybdopterin cofactor-binding domain-containing protein [Xanthocytophaga agilis]MDJ1499576.1 molybdopterin-dependent oxidoreductase [Xanthocytophaga agilis]